jgi:hypothetical protein
VRLSRHLAIGIVSFTSLLLVGAAARTSNAHIVTPIGAATDAEHREVARIRAHFDSVLAELAASPAPNGTPAARRAALITMLRAYRDRGAFPHNYDFPDRAVPYFVDRKTGTLCAVAHLLESTGRRDIVDRVAKANNNVWVAELAADSEFNDWLAANGISLAEAARIQVPYMEPSSPAQVARNTAFMTLAPLSMGTSLVTSLYNGIGNSDGHQRVSRVLGLTSGFLSAGFGTLLLSKPDIPREVGAATTALGGLSVALAFRSTHRHTALVSQQKEAERARGGVQASLSPVVGGAGTGSGVALSIRY